MRAQCIFEHETNTRVYVRVLGHSPTPTHACTRIRSGLPNTLHRCGPRAVGSQAFSSASAFNANIGAWNTASVTTLSYVCNL